MIDRPADFDPRRWKDARWSRWSFRNTAAFLPTIDVAPSRSPRRLQSRPDAPPEGWNRFLVTSYATSALLIQNGCATAAWPDDALDDPRPHMLFSITKSVVGLIARMLVDQRVLSDDLVAARLLPDLENTAFGNARLADLLAMRDGVPFGEDYADPDADIHRYSDGYWRASPGGARARLAALPAQAPVPGFRYRTPVADVVGALCVAATGERLARLLSDLLWQPMGAAHAAHFVLDTAGVEIAGAGLNAATSDLARLALLLVEEGAWDGRQVIPARLAHALFAGGDRAALAQAMPERSGWSYRDFWWHMGGGAIAALGVHGQRMIIDRDRGTILIRTGAQPSPDNRPFDHAHEVLMRSIAPSFASGKEIST